MQQPGGVTATAHFKPLCYPRDRHSCMGSQLDCESHLARCLFRRPMIFFGPSHLLQRLSEQPLGALLRRLMHCFAKVNGTWGRCHPLQEFPSKLLVANAPKRGQFLRMTHIWCRPLSGHRPIICTIGVTNSGAAIVAGWKAGHQNHGWKFDEAVSGKVLSESRVCIAPKWQRLLCYVRWRIKSQHLINCWAGQPAESCSFRNLFSSA